MLRNPPLLGYAGIEHRAAAPAVVALLGALVGCVAPTATRTSTGQVGGAQLTAIYSKASKGYVRVQNADGSFRPESYRLKDGGNFGGPRVDVTMDKLNFGDVSRVIASALASQDYVPSEDPDKAKLVIMVYWGTTIVPDDVNPRDNREGQDPMLASNIDGQIDAQSANILGYTNEIFSTEAGGPELNTLRDEIEQDRYYVVLLAYADQIGRFGPHKLLWETRFSIPEPGNDFERAFPMMASIAAKYFGQDSNGLVHHNLGEGRVEIGEPKAVGVSPDK